MPSTCRASLPRAVGAVHDPYTAAPCASLVCPSTGHHPLDLVIDGQVSGAAGAASCWHQHTEPPMFDSTSLRPPLPVACTPLPTPLRSQGWKRRNCARTPCVCGIACESCLLYASYNEPHARAGLYTLGPAAKCGQRESGRLGGWYPRDDANECPT